MSTETKPQGIQINPIEILETLRAAGIPELDVINRLTFNRDDTQADYEHLVIREENGEYFLLVHRYKGKHNGTEIAYGDRDPQLFNPQWARWYCIPVSDSVPEVDYLACNISPCHGCTREKRCKRQVKECGRFTDWTRTTWRDTTAYFKLIQSQRSKPDVTAYTYTKYDSSI